MKRYLCVGAVALAATDGAMTIEVSPGGSVRGPSEALTKVLALRASGEIGKDVLVRIDVAPGWYELAETLKVTGKHGPLVFRGPNDGKAVFSGGRRLGRFASGADGIWRVPVPKGLVFEQLYVNGKRATVAREPNRGYHYVTGEFDEGKHPLTGKPANLGQIMVKTDPKAVRCLAGLSDAELNNAWVRVFWSWDTEVRRPVWTDPEKGLICVGWKYTRPFFMWPKWCPRVVIENCRAALDAPGEWYLDRRRSELLYVPREGERVETTEAVAAAVPRLLLVEDADRVGFSGITFAHDAFLLPKDGLFEHQSAYFCEAAIETVRSSRVAFRNCRVEHTAGYGLWFNDCTRDSEVRHCWLEDLGAGGVRLGARTWMHWMGGTDTDPDHVVERVTVDDNVICRGGRSWPAGTGVIATYVRDAKITHNEICDFRYSGVCCGWCWSYSEMPNRNNEIAFNHIHHLGKGVLSDMAFIYTLGPQPGSVIRGNHGHDIRCYGYTGSGGCGLYPDMSSSDILWTSNLIHHTHTSALSMHFGRNNRFLNNIFAYNAMSNSAIAARWRVQDHVALVASNNVFVWRSNQLAFQGSMGPKSTTVKDLVFGNNLWWSPDGVKPSDFDYSDFAGWQAQAPGFDAGSRIADPLFADPEKGDFRLKPNSPAFELGFHEWDYSEAGVRKGDPAWRAAAEALVPEPCEQPVEPPLNPGKKSFATGFEGDRIGDIPTSAFTCVPWDNTLMRITDREHRTGRQSLELVDRKGLASHYMPHILRQFKIAAETFVVCFSMKNDDQASFSFAMRDYGRHAKNGSYCEGPQLTVSKGRLRAYYRGESVELPNYAPGKWMDFTITVHAPSNITPTWDLVAVSETGERFEKRAMLYRGDDCSKPNWLGFTSDADWPTTSYIDDFSCESR